MARKVLVTGATGLLGREILQAFEEAGWSVVGTGFSRAKPPRIFKLDVTDSSAVSEFLDREKPHAVIHSAANRFPDKCDGDPEGTRKLNVEATRALARATRDRGIFLLYISTDYVFPGRKGEAPYEADAATQPPNLYGQSKRDGEEAILAEAGSQKLGAVLRVPVLYGKTDHFSESAVNTLVDVVGKAQDGGPNAAVDDWSQRYPTNTEDVARVCKDIVSKYIDKAPAAEGAASLPRILQFTSEDRYTKFEMCALFAEILGLPMDRIEANKQGNDPKASVQRPYDTHLSTKALQGIDIPIWTQDFKAWWKRELHAYRH